MMTDEVEIKPDCPVELIAKEVKMEDVKIKSQLKQSEAEASVMTESSSAAVESCSDLEQKIIKQVEVSLYVCMS